MKYVNIWNRSILLINTYNYSVNKSYIVYELINIFYKVTYDYIL